MPKTSAVSIRLDPELKAALEALAAKDHRNLTNYVTLVLAGHVIRETEKDDE